jgi:hypothetical protein
VTREEGKLHSSENNASSAESVGAAGSPVLAPTDARELATKQAVSQELGVLLIVSGIAGILLPGPVGTPLLILGCVMVWPKAFKPINVFFASRFPRTHHLGAVQCSRFLSDLERRYPVSR